jgi:Na+/H+ antiporter NhaD/arsenite permease-like protein
MFCRELVQITFVALSLFFTPRGIRKENNFNYVAILEVACLFIGIFICMQVPIEILNIKGPSLGINSPAKFFWATGALSSFLDNAPTYVVFFETAKSLPIPGHAEALALVEAGHVKFAPRGQLARSPFSWGRSRSSRKAPFLMSSRLRARG